MKNIVENQGIKTDKPLPMSYEALKAERDALERQLLMSEAKCKGYFSDAAAALIKSDALAVENACLVRAITDHKNSTHFCERCGEDDPCATDDVCSVLRGIPDTDSAIASIEARVWAEAKDLAKSAISSDSADHIDFLFDGKIQQLREPK
ncbi:MULTISPECIES: hypothetical protein [Serratia]|uniref:hypothetical protein n=1 Tax=Serratia TaxID=613 RepID=UPI0027E5531A|nr:hypothetical protein [Serratia marcescens]MCW7560798.1 hypothetical protein [Serratia marcescens]MCW7565625.1 hypothetical protein [Serratia marcescens]MCW7570626.1 hypothetical protein [Serratia marcescens]MCW7575907.1 hypothetical protein [Serratia marcescens]MCW7580626.1 hypothetical protein [Serratia marcescens]